MKNKKNSRATVTLPKLARYLYSGPMTAVTLRDVGDVLLIPGQEVDLPVASSYVQRTIAKKRLAEVKPEALKAPAPDPEAAAQLARLAAGNATSGGAGKPTNKSNAQDTDKQETK